MVSGIGQSVIRGFGFHLTTGQWSAESPAIYFRGSQITLCRHSHAADNSNL